MIRRRKGIIKAILTTDNDITEAMVDVDGQLQKALNYNALTGPIHPDDQVILNTSAVHLGLGTGGHHFIIANLKNHASDLTQEPGHIIKLRYTPLQLKCMTVEEPGSPYHNIMKEADNLKGMPVIICELHSALIPIVKYLNHLDRSLKIAYIMTDSACLPISYSKSVKALKEENRLSCSITCGQAFGGDYETVNIYTALLAARFIADGDLALVIPGPGVVGTGTAYGFSGIEQGGIIDAVNSLDGTPIFVPRINFADTRKRHYGMSHHSITVLERIANTPAFIPIPLLEAEKLLVIREQIASTSIECKHNIAYIHENTQRILGKDVSISTMGKGFSEAPDYFRTLGAAAEFVYARLVNK